jgi:chaperonin GroES
VTESEPTSSSSKSSSRPSKATLPDTTDAIRMTADRLLVEPSAEHVERKSRAGILIPATADTSKRLMWGGVKAVGPTVRTVEEGDLVLFAPDTGFEVEVGTDEYLSLRERDVHAVASGRTVNETGLYL